MVVKAFTKRTQCQITYNDSNFMNRKLNILQLILIVVACLITTSCYTADTNDSSTRVLLCQNDARCELPHFCGPGECASQCPLNIEYVCGKDGNTYANECVMRSHHVELNHEGQCDIFSVIPYDLCEHRPHACSENNVVNLSPRRNKTSTQCGPGLRGNFVETCYDSVCNITSCEIESNPRSVHSCDKSVLIIEPNALVVDKQSYNTWTAVLNVMRTEGYDDLLIKPGNYTDWGPLVIRNIHGIPNRPKTIRFHDPETEHLHPAHRSHHAYVDSIALEGVNDWFVHGITIDHNQCEERCRASVIVGGNRRNTFDSLLMQNYRPEYALRIRNSYRTCVQDSVIRNRVFKPNGDDLDGAAINIKPVHTSLVPHVSDVRIVNNEIYNFTGDGVLIGQSGPAEATNVIIDNNDFYTNTDYYLPGGHACSENAVDVKTGSDRGIIKISNNRMWGFKEANQDACNLKGLGSPGHAILIHILGRSTHTQHNVIIDAPFAYKLERDTRYVLGSRNDVFTDNWLGDIDAVFDLGQDSHITDNHIFGETDYLCYKRSSANYFPSSPIFADNRWYGETDLAIQQDNLNVLCMEHDLIRPTRSVPLIWQRKLITKQELVISDSAVAVN